MNKFLGNKVRSIRNTSNNKNKDINKNNMARTIVLKVINSWIYCTNSSKGKYKIKMTTISKRNQMLTNRYMSNSLPLKLKGYLLSKSMHNSKAKERNKIVSQLAKLNNKTMSKNRNNNRDNNKNKNRERSKLKNRLLLVDIIMSTSVLQETMNQGLL